MRKEVLARKIRVRRNDLGIKQMELALAVGKSASHATQWEAGTLRVRHEDFDVLARVLQVSPRFFIEEDYWPPVGQPDIQENASQVFSREELAGSTLEDIQWLKRMNSILHAVPEGERGRFRRKVEDDARSLVEFIKPERGI